MPNHARHRRRRALALALAATMALPGLAFADSLAPTGDRISTGLSPTLDLGDVAPNEEIVLPLDFTLTCGNGSHVDVGQSVFVFFAGGTVPTGGDIISVTDALVGPAPADWPADGATCPTPAPSLTTTAATTVTLRAPAVPGDDYEYFLSWGRALTPSGGSDSVAVRGGTTLTVFLDVVVNTPPTITVPADLTVEGDTTGGWSADFAVGAADAEDDPDPSPSCDVAQGDVVPLGTTTVTCTVEDAGGLTATDSFDVTVVDTTAPTLAVPADVTVTTPDPSGTTVTFGAAVISDVVDPAPTGGCAGSGGFFPVGTTTVACSATDASGNTRSGTFTVTVQYVPVHVATATWGEPVGVADGGTFQANRGRNVPVKVTLRVDGVVRTTGAASLTIAPCGGARATALPLTYSGGRWNASIDTGPLSGTCHVVTASIDGLTAGSFRLDLSGAEPAKAKGKK